MMSFPPFLSLKIFLVCLLISVFVFDKPTCGAFVLFCIYHFWSSLGSLDLGFFYYVLTVLTHYYFKYFFCSVLLFFSLWPSTNTYTTSLLIVPQFSVVLFCFFFFFFILFVFAFQYGHHETHSFIPWLCWGQISLVHLLYSPLDTGPPYTFFLRESVTCNSFSCNLLLLYWCPDYIVIYCKGKGTFYNFLVSDYHPLVDLCFKVISPVV